MKFSARIDSSLPQLAWLAEIDRETLAVRATVGSSVEVGSDLLVAGVWVRPFQDVAFDNTDTLLHGSAGWRRELGGVGQRPLP